MTSESDFENRFPKRISTNISEWPNIFERCAGTAAGLSSNFEHTSCPATRLGSNFESRAKAGEGLISSSQRISFADARADITSERAASSAAEFNGKFNPETVRKQGRALLSKASAVFSGTIVFPSKTPQNSTTYRKIAYNGFK